MAHPRRSVDLSAYPDLVVIYLGFRITSWRSLRTVLSVGGGLGAIRKTPPDGLLCHENLMFGLLHPGFRQYWRDFESLEAFTRAPLHAGWWRGFAKGASRGGIWHETYRMRGGMEATYSNVPAIGFGRFAPERVPQGPFMSARQRIEARA
jgi:hypothetical protein